ncbi:cilia- and flagella-associated protein 157 [Megalops cyprinoides]|uniref:cilia- and flagella-associated protein 157 n=1 Tax=Megalops cyprinoides TaxID=118141 RepID=UPI00186498A5|nr:cilia- and flagella-associated protein 157 [Megalops cyprinoides]
MANSLVLFRYQKKCDELVVQQRDFSFKYSSLEKEKKDIVHFLKRSLTQKEDELSDLSEHLLVLKQAKEAEKESLEKQVAQLRHEFQEQKDQLTSENMVLAGKLAALEEFRVQKEEFMSRFTTLEEQLEEQKQKHQIVIYNLERKAVLDNNRLKKEMQQHVAAVTAELRLVSDRKMPETTIRAIHENASVTSQLRRLADKSDKLLEENQVLRQRKKQLKWEGEVLKPVLKETNSRSLSIQKVVHQLMVKYKQQCVELEENEKRLAQHAQLQRQHSALQQDFSSLRQELESVKGELEKNSTQVERLRQELMKEQSIRRQLETVLQEAAMALKQALKEVPNEEDSEVMMLARRNQMLQKLFVVLDSAALLGKGPALTEFIVETDSLHEHKKDQGPQRPGIILPLLKATKHMCHYKMGDLGLVPQSNCIHMPKMEPFPVSTHLHTP